ncbi:MAG: hypothetical protein QGG40_04900, partial [Myxococcota bacterium]|nr:hypothetical protein [Myxococcota bacterium]
MASRTRIPLLRRLAYSVVATVVFFVLLECVLWGVAWFSASALQDSLPPPLDDEASIENLGDADRALVCLGDSVTWGMPGPPGYSYPNRLGGMLRDTGTRVVNLGRPGWGMQVLAQALGQIVRNNTTAKS